MRAGPGEGPSLPQPLGPLSWARLAQAHTRDTGGSAHVLQQKATEQRAGAQQEREGAREDHDHIEQESEAVVSCGERTWVGPGVAWGLGRPGARPGLGVWLWLLRGLIGYLGESGTGSVLIWGLGDPRAAQGPC